MINYSVVIPFGKFEGDVTRCVKSALDQKILPEKILVVCNGKVTVEYAASLLKPILEMDHDNRVNLIYSGEIGNANIARNVGIDNCPSEWVAFLDSDDWWDCRWVEVVNEKIKKEQPDFIYGSFYFYDQEGNRKKSIARNYSIFFTPENYLSAFQSAQTSTYFSKTSLAKRIKWDEQLIWHQDYDFFVRIVKEGIVSVISLPFVNREVETRRHKHHIDCYKVLKRWNGHANYYFYNRHVYGQIVSAIKSKDWIAIPYLLSLFLISKNNHIGRIKKQENV
jgi:glycosyltransferase involved in cell wall biosynthesis